MFFKFFIILFGNIINGFLSIKFCSVWNSYFRMLKILKKIYLSILIMGHFFWKEIRDPSNRICFKVPETFSISESWFLIEIELQIQIFVRVYTIDPIFQFPNFCKNLTFPFRSMKSKEIESRKYNFPMNYLRFDFHTSNASGPLNFGLCILLARVCHRFPSSDVERIFIYLTIVRFAVAAAHTHVCA